MDRKPSLLALTPFAVFALFYVGLSVWANDFYRVPMAIAFLVASACAMVFGHREPLGEKVEVFAKGMGETNIMIMCLIFILAGAFATVAKEAGAVDAAVTLARAVVPPRLMLAGVFGISCLISLAVGTSCGTIAAVSPIALGFAAPLGLSPALLLAATVGGSMFGDNLSMISDTTIAATRTQGVRMRDKFITNAWIALPAAVLAVILYALVGRSAADVSVAVPVTWHHFVLVLPYILILVLALCGLNVMMLLFLGAVLASGIGIALGRFDFFGALDLVGKGTLGMSETLIVAILAGGLFALVRHHGGIDALVTGVSRLVKGPRSCEAGTFVLVSAINAFTANNTVAIVIAGPIAKALSDRFKADPVRIASILDTASCVIQGVIPYGAQTLIAIGVAKGLGVDFASIDILRYFYYQAILALAVGLWIAFSRRPKAQLACALVAMTSWAAFADCPQVVPSLKEWKDGEGVWAPASAAEMAAGVTRTLARTGLGPEGYILEVTSSGARITAETKEGAFWATRTLKQVIDRTGSFPCGTAKDWPDYPVRGFMFDCGRKPFALSTLRKIVDICSYYKLNDLQLHLSDNYIWLWKYPNVKTAEEMLRQEPTAGGFRLESKVKGLSSTDICYSKKDFKALCAYARKHGVRIVPELDVPGHALQFIRARPDLMYRGSVGTKHDLERAAMFDLTNPKSFDFIASIFDEYIDGGVFSGDVVHIGADEYYGDAESYRAFADKMLKHILKKGKTPRFWGSLSIKKGRTPVVAKGTQMNIWSMDWQKPLEAIKAGYTLVNILDCWTYSVPNGKGDVGCYRDDIDTRELYRVWGPRIFSWTDPKDVPQRAVAGGAWAMWNDNSFMTDPGLCGRDLLTRIAKNCAAVAEKTWTEGPAKRPYEDFLALVSQDYAHLGVTEPGPVEKTFRTGRTDKPLYESDELTLWAVSPVNGKVGFRREGAEYNFDYEIPKGKTVELTFASANREATLKVNGEVVGGTPRRQYFPDACRYFTLPM